MELAEYSVSSAWDFMYAVSRTCGLVDFCVMSISAAAACLIVFRAGLNWRIVMFRYEVVAVDLRPLLVYCWGGFRGWLCSPELVLRT